MANRNQTFSLLALVLLLARCAYSHYLGITKPECGTILVLQSSVTIEWRTEEVEEPYVKFILRSGPAPLNISPDVGPSDALLAEFVNALSNANPISDSLVAYSTVVNIPQSFRAGVAHIAVIFHYDDRSTNHRRTSLDVVVLSAQAAAEVNVGFTQPAPGPVYLLGAPLTVQWNAAAVVGSVYLSLKNATSPVIPNTGSYIIPGSKTAAIKGFKRPSYAGEEQYPSNFFVVLWKVHPSPSIAGISSCFEMEIPLFDVFIAPAAYSRCPVAVSWTAPAAATVASYSLAIRSENGAVNIPVASALSAATLRYTTTLLSAGRWYVSVTAELSSPFFYGGTARTSLTSVSPTIVVTNNNGLCGPPTPSKKPATPSKRPASPTKKLATPTKKLATPTKKLATPTKKLATPTKKLATPTKKLATPTKRFASATRKVIKS